MDVRKQVDELNFCLICNKPLNSPKDPLSEDLGGDCVECMAKTGDPEAMVAVALIKERVRVSELVLSDRYGIGSMCSQWDAKSVVDDLYSEESGWTGT